MDKADEFGIGKNSLKCLAAAYKISSLDMMEPLLIKSKHWHEMSAARESVSSTRHRAP